MLTTEELCKEFSTWINGAYSSDIKTFVESVTNDHRTLQQCTFTLVMGLIQAWAHAYDMDMYDGRNEFTCQKSKEILDKVENMEFRAPYI